MSRTFWKKKPAFQTFSRSSCESRTAAELTVGSEAPGKFCPEAVTCRRSFPMACPPHEKVERRFSRMPKM